MRAPAPAKINLHLRVGPPRASDDNFHPLLTWMVTAGLFDTLTFVRQPPAPAATQLHRTGLVDLDYVTSRTLIQYQDVEDFVIRRV